MSDAPEQIWVCPEDDEREWVGEWKPHMGPWVEYIRADRIEALTEQLEAARRDAKEAEACLAGRWQPIETAPRDGTRVLAYWPDCYGNNAACQVESWFGAWGKGNAKMTWQSAFEWGDGHNDPTHWMPLPEPPKCP